MGWPILPPNPATGRNLIPSSPRRRFPKDFEITDLFVASGDLEMA
jgi:hypothetical protein